MNFDFCGRSKYLLYYNLSEVDLYEKAIKESVTDGEFSVFGIKVIFSLVRQ